MMLIVAVTGNWGIGHEGKLLCHVREDMRHFRALTAGRTVILGAATLATFPGGRPLKNRRNIVLSRHLAALEGAEIARGVGEALALLAPDEEAVVIGGASVYMQMLPYCDTAIVTKFDLCPPADAIFPDLDASPDREIAETGAPMTAGEEDSHPGMTYRFVTYRRK